MDRALSVFSCAATWFGSGMHGLGLGVPCKLRFPLPYGVKGSESSPENWREEGAMKPIWSSMLAALVLLMLLFAPALAYSQGQRWAQTPGCIPSANASPMSTELIALQQVGCTSVNGVTSPMWAIRIGDTEAAEKAAAFWMESSSHLGANSINGIVWVRDGEGWIKATYKRPRSAVEFSDFLESPELFASRKTGDISVLPFPFKGLNANELQKVDFIVTYLDGGTKAYIQSGLSEDEAISLLRAVLRSTVQIEPKRSDGRMIPRGHAKAVKGREGISQVHI
jgi:hypothetical protein